MESPPTPWNESSRLDALQRLQILDTAAEHRFDRYTRLASRLFDVPIALITLIDSDRQWFKSNHGIDARETPREISICAHAVLQDAIFEIPDTASDPRFADNPLVTGHPHVRFYASALLVSMSGHNLGTFCLIDSKPKVLTDDERESLSDIASMVSDELSVFVDELTGVINRRGFRNAVDSLLASQGDAHADMALVLFDIDKLKKINDGLGHAAGDYALQRFAKLITDACRRSDIVCRQGGDEFCVFLPGATGAIAKERVVALQKLVDYENRTSGLPHTLEFSYGICSTNCHSSRLSLAHMIRKADRLLYRHKATKKARTIRRVSGPATA